MEYIDAWISYPSPYQSHGTAFKQLNVKELSILFGFPTQHHSLLISRQSFHLVPLHILNYLLSPTLNVNPSCSALSTIFPVRPYSTEDNVTFLPSLPRGLPHLWRQTDAVSPKAVKYDDASVSTLMWDARISFLFPSFTSPVLHTLRCVALAYIFKKLFNAFLSFMSFQYGTLWDRYLDIKGSFCQPDKRERERTSKISTRT